MSDTALADEGVKYVRVTSCDVNGLSRGFLLEAEFFKRHLKSGIPMFGGTGVTFNLNGAIVHGNGQAEEKDFRDGFMYPDMETYRVLPWKPHVANVMVDFRLSPNDNQSQLLSTIPRNVCKQQLARLEAMGMRLYSAFEYEFVIIHRDSFEPADKNCSFLLLHDTLWAEVLSMEIMEAMKKQGIEPEMFHQEYAPGQLEISMRPAFGLTASDNALRFKSTVKEIAVKHGFKATFMSKSQLGFSGSSGHFNHSLWSLTESKNLFYDANCEWKLSEVAKQWIAGLQHHADALMAFFCPTTNCYRRIADAMFCPNNDLWGLDNRTCMIRVKNYDDRRTYAENRVAGAASNPYLVTAACLIAGMDGIEKKMQLSPPYKGYATNDTNRKLPDSLQSALEALEKSELFPKVLGEEFMKGFLANKRQELKHYEDAGKDAIQWEQKYYADKM